MRTESLDARKREILAVAIRTHIATGEPVPSAVVARKCGRRISSATIRNEMASLEKSGFLNQPHTSAGRTPTVKAYRFYAREVAARARLSAADQKWINRNLGPDREDAEALATRVPHVLAELCHGVGLVLVPPLAGTALDQVRFVLLGRQRVLAVVVNQSGLVRDKVVRTRETLRSDELERMSAYLNENFRGWSLERIRAEMERRVTAERSKFLHKTLALCRQTFRSRKDRGDLRLEGVAHLTEQAPAASPEEWRELLHALEEKERLARLLGDCVDSPDQFVRVVIGLEQLAPAMRDFVLIGAPYGRQEGPAGSLGLLGRTRMDYDRAVTAVAYVASLIDQAWAGN
jgi:heat-inducible transcriptional repressor